MIRHIPAAQARGRVEPFPEAAASRDHAPSGADAHARDARAEAARQKAAVTRALTLLLSEELALKPEHIERVLERELARVRRARELVVRVHPDDLPLLRAPDHYVRALELEGALRLETDAALSRGGCTLSSELGEIDARLEIRLALALTLLERGALP